MEQYVCPHGVVTGCHKVRQHNTQSKSDGSTHCESSIKGCDFISKPVIEKNIVKYELILVI